MVGTMHIQHKKTLKRVFSRPAPGDVPWSDVESMLRAAGVQVKERSGSRIALVKDDEVMVLRRPHQKPIALKATIRDIAAFLKAAGVSP